MRKQHLKIFMTNSKSESHKLSKDKTSWKEVIIKQIYKIDFEYQRSFQPINYFIYYAKGESFHRGRINRNVYSQLWHLGHFGHYSLFLQNFFFKKHNSYTLWPNFDVRISTEKWKNSIQRLLFCYLKNSINSVLSNSQNLQSCLFCLDVQCFIYCYLRYSS